MLCILPNSKFTKYIPQLGYFQESTYPIQELNLFVEDFSHGVGGSGLLA